MRMTTLLAAAGVIAALNIGSALAQDQYKLGSTKAGNDIGLTFDHEFIDGVNKGANGAFNVEHQFVGNEQEMVQQVVRGRLQFGVTSAFGIAGAVPDAAAISVPFLWASTEERIFVTEKYLRPLLEQRFADKGLKLLSMQESGYNGIFCKFDCSAPESLKGQKARVSASLVSQAMWRALGSNGVQLSIADLWPGLEQGLVVAGDLPMNFYVTTPGVQSAPHFVVTNHLHHPWIYFMNKGLWDRLPADTQNAILASIPEDNSTSDRYFGDEVTKMDVFTGMGGTVHRITPEQQADWAAVVAPQMGEVVDAIGPGAREIYDAALKGKEEFAKQSN